MDKYFTLQEAEQLLPLLKKEIHSLQQLQQSLKEKAEYLHELKDQQAEDGAIFQTESELEFIQLQAKLHIQNIHRQGVWLKSVEFGLLDFPSMLDGEEVLLCWKQGEDEIRYYHAIDSGFMGRIPIEKDQDFSS
ncbi:DUF2203 domain-containing protein [Marinicrinis sediminis]|uniref:DUF2203 domain-containing protein n=1 Tax=Marinicrinis sediminis TaxID=1652465 RepID=A0ABW5R9J9_9BACL